MASAPDLTPSSSVPTTTTNKQIPIKTAARKLPVKRKTTDGDNNNPNLSPIPDPNPNPLKFHRIWSDSDEIQFLQGLIDSTKMGLIFPRDLGLLQFSQGSMSKSYTKNQLYEKHRRLREKFRVISGRITRGLDFSLVNSHDQSLFALSKQLWDSSSSSSSPLVPSDTNRISLESGVKVTAPAMVSPSPQNENVGVKAEDDGDDGDDGMEINSDENNLESGHEEKVNVQCELGKMVAETVLDVFDRSLEEVRMGLVVDPEPDASANTTSDDKASAGSSKQERAAELIIRCQEQRVAEFDVLARRLRLVLENDR